MIYRHLEPTLDAEAYYSQKENELARLPRCSECGEPLTERAYSFDDVLICEDCMNENHRVWVEDLEVNYG